MTVIIDLDKFRAPTVDLLYEKILNVEEVNKMVIKCLHGV